jgi:Rha family phage regulatory protein
MRSLGLLPNADSSSVGSAPIFTTTYDGGNMQTFTSSDLIAVTGDKLTTDTLAVARKFDKQHSKVMRAALALRSETGEWGVANFGETLHIDPQNGQSYRRMTMTKDGFMLLVMGFTGTEALKMKLDFIAAFNMMAEYIASGERNLWQQMQALIAKEVNSQVRATFGSHLMLKRKREIPPLRDERALLEAAIQPSLLTH